MMATTAAGGTHSAGRQAMTASTSNGMSNCGAKRARTDLPSGSSCRGGNQASTTRIRRLNALLDEELQKEQQGISSDQVLEELMNKLKNNNAEGPPDKKPGKYFKEDANALKKFAQIAISKVSALRDNCPNTVNMGLFVERLKQAAGAEDGGSPLLVMGEHAGQIFLRTLNFNYVGPCIADEANTTLGRVKKERKKREQSNQQLKEVHGRTTRDAHGTEQDDNSIMRELDVIRKNLKEAWKVNRESNSIDYYSFVLHPTDFGQTVENMFFVSFLVRDAAVRLKTDERTGLPTIERINRQDRESLQSADSTTQHLSTITFSTWQRLVEQLRVKQPMIKRGMQC